MAYHSGLKGILAGLSKSTDHPSRMISAGFRLSLVWDWRLSKFQLSGFYCRGFKHQASKLAPALLAYGCFRKSGRSFLQVSY